VDCWQGLGLLKVQLMEVVDSIKLSEEQMLILVSLAEVVLFVQIVQ